MGKIWKSILETLGFSGADADKVIDIAKQYPTSLAILTILVLVLTVAVPILVTRPIADWFDRRAKRGTREERIRDVTVATYYEISAEFKGMIEAFADAPAGFQTQAQKIREDTGFFPLWTFNENDLFVFEGYVKSDIAIFPSSLIGPTVEIYRSAGNMLAYLKDSRARTVGKFAAERKIQFLQNFYDAAYEHIVVCCNALIAYEKWQHKTRVGYYADLDWLWKMSEFDFSKLSTKTPHHPGASHQWKQRVQTYRMIRERFNGLLSRPLDGGP